MSYEYRKRKRLHSNIVTMAAIKKKEMWSLSQHSAPCSPCSFGKRLETLPACLAFCAARKARVTFVIITGE